MKQIIYDVVKKFQELYQTQPRIFCCPGRVNLIGEHTDYNEGYVLPMLINNATYLAIAPRQDNKINIYSFQETQSVTLNIEQPFIFKKNVWTNYVEGILRLLKSKNHAILGADVVVHSDIPLGAGLSSSAAFEISVGYAFLSLAGSTNIDRVELALLGQKAEHEFVGTKCGIMDQLVCATGKENHALFIDCKTLATENVPFASDEYSIVVCNSMVKHALATSEYNTRRAECEKGIELLKEKMNSIQSLRNVTEDDFTKYSSHLPSVIKKRCAHVISENSRVLRAIAALKVGKMDEFGKLMIESHESLKNDYAVSCHELDILVEIALKLEGVLGARMTGGGFGGCVIALVKNEYIDTFKSNIAKLYSEKTSIQPDLFVAKCHSSVNEIKI
ncbi:MAG: galactokinase [Bdellovibrionota bacterium]